MGRCSAAEPNNIGVFGNETKLAEDADLSKTAIWAIE